MHVQLCGFFAILRENSCKVVWLFLLSYVKVHVNVYDYCINI